MLFTPSYFQVSRDLDLTLPMTLTYNPRGKSPLPAFNSGANNGGVASVGIAGEYRKAWIANLQGSYFFGPEPFQRLGDRQFVSFSIQYSF
jgi:hypothetical protein